MAGLWIDAASALRLVASASGETEGAQALCARAHAGLVKTRARLLVHKERRAENVELPPDFWWAEGHEALEQHWPTGDFTTLIGSKGEYRAFGITFDLDRVLGMLPVEERALVARRFSVAGDPAWINARDAFLFAREKGKFQMGLGAQAIVAQARLGFITARAVLVERMEAPPGGRLGPAKQEREWDVPDWFWQRFMGKGSSQDWTSGIFEGQGRDANGPCVLKLTNVHFLTTTLDVLLPATTQPAPAEPQKVRAGGRPAQPWWDDLWCAVWGVIHQGDFTPKTQADVEKAMLAWAAMNGHEVSEAAVRPKARKLFQTLKGEATNFLAR